MITAQIIHCINIIGGVAYTKSLHVFNKKQYIGICVPNEIMLNNDI